MEPSYLIPEGLLGALIDYLAKRPYGEVAAAIAALRGLARHEPSDPSTKENTNG